jgi:BlaR1 peptidase M56
MSSESARMLWTVLAEASIRAAVAAALAGAILTVARTRAPGVRHAIWTAITLAMLAMPLLPRALPAVRVAMPQPIELWADAAPPADASLLPTPADRARRVSGTTAAPPAANGRVSLPPASRQIDWPAALADLYLAGLLASLLYVGAGWLAMTAIVRRSRPIALADGSVVHESAIVAAPLTAGVFRPRIILPANWRAWPAETLRAVITHERTHLRRRDPLIALAARVNRCVFWFHPLAWWLESKLASVAEFACDETASRACRAPAEYAQMLVEIADDVRRHGGRLAWQGIAVSGNGQLKDRIERLLAGTPWPAASRRKKALVACACVLAVAIAAACRPAAHAEALKPDPALAARLAERKARTARDSEARRMTPEQVAALETAVARNPDDRESREKLLAYYGDVRRQLDPAAVVARRAHILWMIQHHPDADAASLRLYTIGEDRWLPDSLRPTVHANADPDGYAQAKRLWLAAMAKPDVSVQTLTNAARFFEMADKPLAEAAYLKAAEREPGKWSGELGRLYALTIVGSDASLSYHVMQHVSMAAAHSTYADQIRRKLEDSTDPKLLASAGQYLLNAEWLNTMDHTPPAIDFDVRAQATKYLERAVELDPTASPAAALLASRRSQERSWRVFPRLQGTWRPTPEAVAALPETERLDILWKLISDAFYQGENLWYNRNDKAGARAAWQRLSIYANDALTIGPRHPDHPDAGQAMFNAHEFLGTVALWDGDVRTALAHLDAASGVPVSETMKYAGGAASNRLVRWLVKAGEYDAVARYYDRMAQINVQERKLLTESAQAIRAGKMPEWYQMVTEGEAGR